MKINGHENIGNLQKAYSGDRITKSERQRNADQMHKGEQSNAAGDKVNISSEGAQIQHLKSLIDQIPDTRQERVNTIKQNIESGKYQISNDNTARAIIRENAMDHLL